MISAKVRAYFRTPKGMLLLVLAALTGVAFPFDGQALLPRMAASVAAAVVVDLLFMSRRGNFAFPDSAILTGAIVAMVLSPAVPLGVPILASALAITSKRLLRSKQGHFLNPAAAGLLVSGLLFSSEQSWWGGLGDAPAILVVAVAAAGLVIADRVNKWPSVATFGLTYVGLLTLASRVGDPLAFADAFREPMTGAAVFFACFMLTDPPTSPARVGDQVRFSIVAAVVSVGCLALNAGGVYDLLVGLLTANALEGARRLLAARRRPATVALRFPSAAVG